MRMRMRMLYAMAWRDLRGTFIGTMIFLTVFAASAAFAFKVAMEAATHGATNPSWVQLARAPQAYERFLDAMWFRVPGPSFVIALAAVLVATAIPIRARAPDTSFLLLLPWKRQEILGTRVITFAVLMFALSLTVSIVFVLVGWLGLGQNYPVGKAIGVALLYTVASLGWAGVSVAIASFVHRAIAVAIVLTLIYLIPLNLFQLTIPPEPGPGVRQTWNMWAMTDPALWGPSVPWIQIGLTLGAALVGWFVAVRQLETMDI